MLHHYFRDTRCTPYKTSNLFNYSSIPLRVSWLLMFMLKCCRFSPSFSFPCSFVTFPSLPPKCNQFFFFLFLSCRLPASSFVLRSRNRSKTLTYSNWTYLCSLAWKHAFLTHLEQSSLHVVVKPELFSVLVLPPSGDLWNCSPIDSKSF